MKIISTLELRRNLDKYQKLAAQGETFMVTRRNKPAMIITPPAHNESSNTEAVFAAAEKFWQTFSQQDKDRIMKLTDQDIEQYKRDHRMQKYGTL